MRIFAIDIGNSSTKFAIVEDFKVLNKTQLSSEDEDAIADALPEIYNRFTLDENTPIVVCSVVETISRKVETKSELALDIVAEFIGRDIPFPIELNLEDKSSVGADRVISAAIAYERIGQAVVVATFGTAITIDLVDDKGVFSGGVILPGLQTSIKALSEYTFALPKIELTSEVKFPGKTTVQAMNAGVILGATGALREIVERFATQIGKWPELIITGGDAKLIRPYCDFAQAIVEDLTLMGIELAYERWKEQSSSR